MATINSVNVGLSGSTGSGSFAGSTSPTFVTPLLGTPTSGTLTNCTGYPVANLANLGAGVATWLATPTSTNLRTAVATTSTGTGSLVFDTSPTITTPNMALINDSNGNPILGLTAVASGANYISLRNSAAGSPLIIPIGASADINLALYAKGAGIPSTLTTGNIAFSMISGTGYQHQTLFSMANTAVTRTVTWPDADGTALMTGQAISTVPSIAFSSTSGVIGTTTNNNAAAGSVGEFVSSVVLVGSAVAMTTAISKTITSISLTAGDWDIWGSIWTTTGAGTLTGYVSGAISLTTDTTPTTPAIGESGILDFTTVGAGYVFKKPITPTRASLSGTTTYYLVGESSFSASTLSMYGNIMARRVR